MSKAEMIQELRDVIDAVNYIYDLDDKYSEPYEMGEDYEKELRYEKLDYILETAENLIQELRKER